jgi:gamma-glutamylaminecyclotransferase
VSSPERTNVFVYGTLKSDGRNHRLLAGSPQLAKARTITDYPLFISELPYLLDVPGIGTRVNGEVYSVSDRTLAFLDRLESHPRFYRRRVTTVIPTSGAVADKPMRVYAYFLSFQYLSAAHQRALALSMSSYPNHYAHYDLD